MYHIENLSVKMINDNEAIKHSLLKEYRSKIYRRKKVMNPLPEDS